MLRARRTISSTKRSFSSSATIKRAPAEHTCPELTKAAFRALSTAASKRASAKITFGFLPPSSSATFLTVAAAAAATRLPVTSPPVNDTRSTSGWLTQRGARHRSGTEYQVGHPRRKPDLGEHAHQQHRGVRGELAGLEDEGVSGRQCRGNLPGRLQQRVVPRRDQPAYAHRLVDDAAEHPGTSRFDNASGILAGTLSEVGEAGDDVVHVELALDIALAGIQGLRPGEGVLADREFCGYPQQQVPAVSPDSDACQVASMNRSATSSSRDSARQ
jgi:hypothetical protein